MPITTANSTLGNQKKKKIDDFSSVLSFEKDNEKLPF